MKYEITKGSEKDFEGGLSGCTHVYDAGAGRIWCSGEHSVLGSFRLIAERRPITKPVWDGEDLPPIGLLVEYKLANRNYRSDFSKGTVLFYGEQNWLIKHWSSGNEFLEPVGGIEFRPIRQADWRHRRKIQDSRISLCCLSQPTITESQCERGCWQQKRRHCMSIILRSGIWHCHFYTSAGKRIRRSLGTSDKKQAQELYDKLKAEAWRVDNLDDLPTRTFEECCIRWIDEKQHKRSLDDDKTKIEFFLGHFGGRDISTITSEQIMKSVASMPNRKHRQVWESISQSAIKNSKEPPPYTPKQVSQATKSQYLSFIRGLLRTVANDWGWIKSAPVIKTRKPVSKPPVRRWSCATWLR